MTWIAPENSRALTLEEQQSNALEIYTYFSAQGWTINAICGMLGNMQSESAINPRRWQNDTPWGNPEGQGFGLTQWTPYTKITEWLAQSGIDPDTGSASALGQSECERIQWEVDNDQQWIGVGDYASWSFLDYTRSTESVIILADAFIKCYERPSDPDQPQRGIQATYWFTYLSGVTPPTPISGRVPIFLDWAGMNIMFMNPYTHITPPEPGEYTPRLDDSGMLNNPIWYDDNIFYQSGYGLPNCTCYAYGRWWELLGYEPNLSHRDASYWYGNTADGYQRGTAPQLGAIICFDSTVSGGHVAVVEQISPDGGSITTSNSAYGGQYFYTQTLKRSNNWTWSNNYTWQGFIYLPTN